jgi:hypothetical protein
MSLTAEPPQEFAWNGYTLTIRQPLGVADYQLAYPALLRLLKYIDYLKADECSGWPKEEK